jgi:hypothetical protein
MNVDDKIKVSDIITKSFLIKATLFLLLFCTIFLSGFIMGKEQSCREATNYALEYADAAIKQYCPLAFDAVNEQIKQKIIGSGSFNISYEVE